MIYYQAFLSTFDTFAVFNEGTLIHHGTHDGLLKDENGKYYELLNAQAQYYN
ncbi:MAG: hypothetical protein IKT37_03770 [Clostridia bacterium]|nr:hypothetical protein [Clostridia bacterium]